MLLFLSEGREQPFIMKAILKTFSKWPLMIYKPEMSAFELTEALVPELERRSRDCFVSTLPIWRDMVGHTGIMSAAAAVKLLINA
jgi:2,3-bisphosphoglycerate-independent phosphoglycerate mutase